MSATDFFPWLPDWSTAVTITYRNDTVINQSETGNEQSRFPLYNLPKRKITCTHFSPDNMVNIENFLRKFHADFFQVPIFTEPILPIGVEGSSLKNVTAIQSTELLSKYNLNNLCSHVLIYNISNPALSELHTLISVDSDTQMTIGGTFTNDFTIGNTMYFPVMQAYTDGFDDTMTTRDYQDTALVFQEYF